jgi:hypothetical protein
MAMNENSFTRTELRVMQNTTKDNEDFLEVLAALIDDYGATIQYLEKRIEDKDLYIRALEDEQN